MSDVKRRSAQLDPGRNDKGHGKLAMTRFARSTQGFLGSTIEGQSMRCTPSERWTRPIGVGDTAANFTGCVEKSEGRQEGGPSRPSAVIQASERG
jgi:hypothetical protein